MDQNKKEPLLPSNSDPFVFSSPSLNLQINGRVPKDAQLPRTPDEVGEDNKTIRVWLGESSESIVSLTYCTDDSPPDRRNNQLTSHGIRLSFDLAGKQSASTTTMRGMLRKKRNSDHAGGLTGFAKQNATELVARRGIVQQ